MGMDILPEALFPLFPYLVDAIVNPVSTIPFLLTQQSNLLSALLAELHLFLRYKLMLFAPSLGR